MNRRQFINTSLKSAVLPASLSFTRCEQQNQPNIIMIYADDLDFDEIEPYNVTECPCYTGAHQTGHFKETESGRYWQNDGFLPNGEAHYFETPRMLTPHLQLLADEGATFTRFYVTTSICTPSRYTLLTGQYASRSLKFSQNFPHGQHAKINWSTQLSPKENNIARQMKKLGYKTGVVGKWHLGVEDARPEGVQPDDDPRDPEVAKKLKQAAEQVNNYIMNDIGFDFADRIYPRNKERIVPESLGVHNLEWITEGALNFIDDNKGQPFFLYMPLTAPHGQYYSGAVQVNPLATPAGLLDKAPQVQPSRDSIFERLEEHGIDKRKAMGTWIDDSVGAVLKKCDDLGLTDNTVVIFSSDHQSRGKFTCYEGCRVPFLIRWPQQIKAGTRVSALTANKDLAATFIEIAGGSPPQHMKQDSRSFLPVLRNDANDIQDSILLETSNIRAVVTKRWKYIANRPPQNVLERMQQEAKQEPNSLKRQIGWSGNKNWHEGQEGVVYGANRDFPDYFDKDQLYDLENDVFEQENLAYDPAYAEIVTRLKEHLSKHLSGLPHTFGEF